MTDGKGMRERNIIDATVETRVKAAIPHRLPVEVESDCNAVSGGPGDPENLRDCSNKRLAWETELCWVP